MDNEQMPKIDVEKDPRISQFNKTYMKRVELKNRERAERVITYRKRNSIGGIGLALLAVGIYSYTIYAVKQEKFLDDFSEPEKIIESPEV